MLNQSGNLTFFYQNTASKILTVVCPCFDIGTDFEDRKKKRKCS